MLGSLGFTVAAAPTDSFVHDDTASGATEAGLTQEMYNAAKVITAGSLGLEKSLSGIAGGVFDKKIENVKNRLACEILKELEYCHHLSTPIKLHSILLN